MLDQVTARWNILQWLHPDTHLVTVNVWTRPMKSDM